MALDASISFQRDVNRVSNFNNEHYEMLRRKHGSFRLLLGRIHRWNTFCTYLSENIAVKVCCHDNEMTDLHKCNNDFLTLKKTVEELFSVDAEKRKKAESVLQESLKCPGFVRVLLRACLSADFSVSARQLAAISLKNFIKSSWISDLEGSTQIGEEDKIYIRDSIVEAMVNSSPLVKKQLTEAICFIGKYDFPSNWKSLLDALVKCIESGDLSIVNSALVTAEQLFRRYSTESKSEKLWREIKYVLDNFADPLTKLFTSLTSKVSGEEMKHFDNGCTMQIYETFVDTVKIFYHLNFQDLPEYFEDHLDEWMGGFKVLLELKNVYSCPEIGNLKMSFCAQICDNLAMFSEKYEEEFFNHVMNFVKIVSQQLLSVSAEEKYDEFLSKGIDFLATVCGKPPYKLLFENGEILSQISECIVLPSLELRACDVDNFENSPNDYVLFDLEGSVAESRRRSACNFISAVCKQFSDTVEPMFTLHLHNLLVQYSEDPAENWSRKSIAINLLLAICCRGTTQKATISPILNVNEFFLTQLKLVFESALGNALLKADILKFLILFRTEIPKPTFVNILPTVRNLLCHDRGPVAVLELSDVAGSYKIIFENLLKALELPDTAHCEYVMRCFMRLIETIFNLGADAVREYFNTIAMKIYSLITSPGPPIFNHLLCESMCLLIRLCGPTDNFNAEDILFPIFQQILQSESNYLLPWVFQMLSLLLNRRTDEAQIPPVYMVLLPHLLNPEVWSNPVNLPSVTHLLTVYMRVNSGELSKEDYLIKVLTIFQRLVFSKSFDENGMRLMNAFIDYGLRNHVDMYLDDILRVVFKRQQENQTYKFSRMFVLLICHMVVRFGAMAALARIENIQNGLFGNIVEKLFIAKSYTFKRSEDAMIFIYGVLQLLYCCIEFKINGVYSKYTVDLLQMVHASFHKHSEIIFVSTEGVHNAIDEDMVSNVLYHADVIEFHIPGTENFAKLYTHAIGQMLRDAALKDAVESFLSRLTEQERELLRMMSLR
ncbi:Exportin-2 [Trichinella murrelli]|uniref:Exportin-2 n=1 Tax=Trichinella murrelli TaxID=144512 RepID=A0A0V0TN02_9BILA|nr:Exportin-2 [Trichinella murrelli]